MHSDFAYIYQLLDKGMLSVDMGHVCAFATSAHRNSATFVEGSSLHTKVRVRINLCGAQCGC